jgi:hypothetical protein
MSEKTQKKIRRGILRKINSLSSMALKNEIFRLARNRDILGITAIIVGIALLIFIYKIFIR